MRYNSPVRCNSEFGLDIARPFIRLPYLFDAGRLADEVGQLPDSAWMAHPQRMSGNTAAALISKRGDDNDDFAGEMVETPHLRACPYLRQVLASYGEVLGRSRLMKLAAGAEVATHVDFNYHWYSRVRIHIPIITNTKVTFYCADQKIHMSGGESWIFNSWRRHRVTNESAEDRVHLVVDLAGSSRFWAVIRKMQQYDLYDDRDKIEALIQEVPFDPAAVVDIRTEKFNMSPVMAPGEVDALVNDLLEDFEHNPKNDPANVAVYKNLLIDFSKDWREIWHLYGFREEGRPLFQRLIDETMNRLSPDRRAVVTRSNDIGVNPIIVQRILRAALATEEMSRFTAQDDEKL